MLINGISICLLSDEEKQQYIKQFQGDIRAEVRKLNNEYFASFANPANPSVINQCIMALAYLDSLISELEK